MSSQPAAPPQRLRDAHTELTRTRLLDAAIDAVAEDGSDALTIRSVAARSGISVPTAYRYFPSKDDLMEAVGRRLTERSRFPEFAGSLEACADYVRRLFPQLIDENATLVRAVLALPLPAEARMRGIATRMAMIRRVVTDSLPDASADAAERASALVHLLLSISTWSHLHDRWGLDSQRAGETAAWAVEVLVEALHDDPEGIVRGSLIEGKERS